MADQNDRWTDDRYSGGPDPRRGGHGTSGRWGDTPFDRGDDRAGEGRSFGPRGGDDRSGFGRAGYGPGDYGDHGYDTHRAANREAAETMMHRPAYGDRTGSSYPGRDFAEPRERPSYRAGPYGQGPSGAHRYGGGFDRDHTADGPRGGDADRGWWDRTRDEVSSWFGDDQAEQRRRRDEADTVGGAAAARSGGHRGKGPKNYTRSDARIQEDVNQHLTDDHEVDATHVEVSVTAGEVTLSGTVERREDKRRAEDLAERVSGVTHVQNNLRVQASATTAPFGGGTSVASTVSGVTGAGAGGAESAPTDDAARI